ncbi:hypothetical protein DSO57_1039790 [Entomophthora muscae]|uniref:Uncharacterized protein n=1 Tax=Entomophthora muscae TaxID=34485 RepID=A0ACC2SBB4_9FUNG|nr:hypothetical protein DSO57_1039790 [Entomophthora muscae]
MTMGVDLGLAGIYTMLPGFTTWSGFLGLGGLASGVSDGSVALGTGGLPLAALGYWVPLWVQCLPQDFRGVWNNFQGEICLFHWANRRCQALAPWGNSRHLALAVRL